MVLFFRGRNGTQHGNGLQQVLLGAFQLGDGLVGDGCQTLGSGIGLQGRLCQGSIGLGLDLIGPGIGLTLCLFRTAISLQLLWLQSAV